jgi:hypothetical protein
MSSTPPVAVPEALNTRSKTITDMLNKLAIVGLLIQIYVYSTVLWIPALHFMFHMENTVDRLRFLCKTLLQTLNLPTTPTYTMTLAFIVLTLVGFSDLVLLLVSFIVGRMMRSIEDGFRAGRTWDEGRPGRFESDAYCIFVVVVSGCLRPAEVSGELVVVG